MPGNSLQKIITTFPNFMAVEPNDELNRFTDLCVERIGSCQEAMLQEEIDVLCYILCSLSNFDAFDRLVEGVRKSWAMIGAAPEVFTHIIKPNLQLVTRGFNRSMHPYGLSPDTPNLVNKVMMLGREGYTCTDALDPQIVEEIFSAFQSPVTQAEQRDLAILERQLWNGPITAINLDELIDICRSPQLLYKFFDKKRNVGNQQTSYISNIFKRLLDAEENFPSSPDGAEKSQKLLNLMDILFNAIDRLGFESQEIALTKLFLESNALLLLEWLKKVVSDQKQRQILQDKIKEIYLEIGLSETDFGKGAQGSAADSAGAEAGQSLGRLKLDQIVEMLGQYGYSLPDIMAMDEELLRSILLSLGINFEEKPKQQMPKQQLQRFGLPWITRQWQDAEFIDKYLLHFREPLLAKECGVMPSITDTEALDAEYIRRVVQGNTGILRVIDINAGDFSEDAPTLYKQLIWPICTGGNHFGLLMLNFDEAGLCEGGIYFEPKKEVGLQNLERVVGSLGDAAILQLNMGQTEDDFCGDYVITVVLWLAAFLNPRIISWAKFEKNQAEESDKISSDPHYSQLIGGAISMDAIECLRCDMAIRLGPDFINYLNPRAKISMAEWETKVLPAITARRRELSAQEQAENTFETNSSDQGAAEASHAVPKVATEPFPSPALASNSNRFFYGASAHPAGSLPSAADQFLDGIPEPAVDDFGLEKAPGS